MPSVVPSLYGLVVSADTWHLQNIPRPGSTWPLLDALFLIVGNNIRLDDQHSIRHGKPTSIRYCDSSPLEWDFYYVSLT